MSDINIKVETFRAGGKRGQHSLCKLCLHRKSSFSRFWITARKKAVLHVVKEKIYNLVNSELVEKVKESPPPSGGAYWFTEGKLLASHFMRSWVVYLFVLSIAKNPRSLAITLFGGSSWHLTF